MKAVDENIKAKVINAFDQITNNLIVPEYKEYYTNYIQTFSQKTLNSLNETFSQSFIAAFEDVYELKKKKTILAANMLFITLLQRLKPTGINNYSQLSELTVDRLCPRLMDELDYLDQELEQIKSKNSNKNTTESFNRRHLLKILMWSIVYLLRQLRKTFKNDKKTYKNYDSLVQKLESFGNIDALEVEFNDINFDIINCTQDLFNLGNDKNFVLGSVVDIEDCLVLLDKYRRSLYTYIMTNPNEHSLEEFDTKIRQYVEKATELQDFFLENQNIQIDDMTFDKVRKEIQFANYIVNDAQTIFDEEELTLNQINGLILRKHAEIFCDTEFENRKSISEYVDKIDETIDIPETKSQRITEPPIRRKHDDNFFQVGTSQFRGEEDNSVNIHFKSNNERNMNLNENFEDNYIENSKHIGGDVRELENKFIFENVNSLKISHIEHTKRHAERDEKTADFNTGFKEDIFELKKTKKPFTKKNENIRFDLKNNNLVQSSDKGFELNEFDNFEDFRDHETGNSKQNFADFGQFEPENLPFSDDQKLNLNKERRYTVSVDLDNSASKPSRPNLLINPSIIELGKELRFSTPVNKSKQKFTNFLLPEQGSYIQNSMSMRSSYTTQIQERFRRNTINISSIGNNSNTSYLDGGSININFGTTRFSSKKNNLTNSKLSGTINPNRQVLKNAMTKYTGTLSSMNQSTIQSIAKLKRDRKKSTTIINMESVKRIFPNTIDNNNDDNKFHEDIEMDMKLDKDEITLRKPDIKEQEHAFGFEDFQSIHVIESQVEDNSIHAASNVIPLSMKYGVSIISKFGTPRRDNSFGFINTAEDNKAKIVKYKTFSSNNNEIIPNSAIETPFDNQNKSISSDSKKLFSSRSPQHDSNNVYKYTLEKHNRELMEIYSNQFNNLNSVEDSTKALTDHINRQKVEFDLFFEKMQNDYDVMIKNIRTESLEQKEANNTLYLENVELQKKIIDLESELEIQTKLKKIPLKSLKNELTPMQVQLEMLTKQHKALSDTLRMTETNYRDKISQKNEEVEKMNLDTNLRLKNIIKENSELKLELINMKEGHKQQLSNLKHQLEGVKSKISDLASESFSKIKAYDDQLKDLSTKFYTLIALKNKLMNDNIVTKSEINFYDKKTKELKDKLQKTESENQLLRNKTIKSSRFISTSSFMILRTSLMNVKAELSDLKKQAVNDLGDYQTLLYNLKQFKTNKILMENRLFSLEIQNNSRIGQINRLNYQYGGIKEENDYLKQQVAELTEQKSRIQTQLFELTNDPAMFIQKNSNSGELSRKVKELEYEVRLLDNINREITEDNLLLKEKLMTLEMTDNRHKMKKTLKQLEAENDDLYHRNKCLLKELYEHKALLHNFDQFKERMKILESENVHVKAMNEQLMVKTSSNHNGFLVESESYEQPHDNLTGMGLIKKYDMYMDMLNKKSYKTLNKTFLQLLSVHQEKSEFAVKCMTPSYCVFNNGGLKIYIDEEIVNSNNNIDLTLKIVFSNLTNNHIYISNFNVCCLDGQIKYSSAYFDIELRNVESAKKEIRLILEQSFLISAMPLLAEFTISDNIKQTHIINNNSSIKGNNSTHSVLLPIALNKLLVYQKSEPKILTMNPNLINVGSTVFKNMRKISKDYISRLIPQLGTKTGNRYGVKIQNIYGTFLVIVDFSKNSDLKLDFYSVYASPIHKIYIDTIAAILQSI